MIDFPNNPVVGQVYASGLGQWQWDGTKWNAIGAYYAPTVANPNKLLNPFLEIDQANEGAARTGSGYAIDGFRLNAASSTGVYIAGRGGAGTGPPGFPAFCLYTQTNTVATSVAAGDNLGLYQTLEADDIYDTGFGTSAAQPLTVSFWAYCTIAGTYYFNLANAAANRSYPAPFTLTAANTWQFFTITIPGDIAGTWVTSGNAAGMVAWWTLGAGTTFQTPTLNAWQSGNFFAGTGISNAVMTTAGAQFRLGPCKLEVGPSATPNLRTSISHELSRCQRYYEKSYDPGQALGMTGTGNWLWNYLVPSAVTQGPGIGGSFMFKVTKRAQPSVSIYSPNSGVNGKLYDRMDNTDITANIIAVGASSVSWYGACSSATQSNVQFGGHFVADARL
jgi:hypothetical protein